MKELIKKYWWVILIIGWGITFLIYSQKIKNKTQDLQFANVELSSLRDTVNTFKTKNGELVGQINSVVIDRDIAKKSLEQIGIDVKKLREENVKLKTLNLLGLLYLMRNLKKVHLMQLLLSIYFIYWKSLRNIFKEYISY